MTFSKRLALFGVQSTRSIAKRHGLGSSYGFIDRRPFPYRQISYFTKDTNPSKNIQDQHHDTALRHKLRTLEDEVLKVKYELCDQHVTALRQKARTLEAEVKKVQTELMYAELSLRQNALMPNMDFQTSQSVHSDQHVAALRQILGTLEAEVGKAQTEFMHADRKLTEIEPICEDTYGFSDFPMKTIGISWIILSLAVIVAAFS